MAVSLIESTPRTDVTNWVTWLEHGAQLLKVQIRVLMRDLRNSGDICFSNKHKTTGTGVTCFTNTAVWVSVRFPAASSHPDMSNRAFLPAVHLCWEKTRYTCEAGVSATQSLALSVSKFNSELNFSVCCVISAWQIYVQVQDKFNYL